MNLVNTTFDYIGWQKSLLRKVAYLALGNLLLNIILFSITQISLFLAFFLPLKVILMVATEGVPGYLRFLVSPENKELYIVLFGLCALFFYLLHLFTDYLAGKSSHKAALKLLYRSKKLALFGNEGQLANDFFLRLSRSLGSLFMVICGFVLGMYLNFLLFSILVFVIILEYVGFCLFWQSLDGIERLSDRVRFIKNLQNLLNFFSSVNFFIGFCVLLYVFFTDPGFGLIRGILCFILIRQIMQRLLAAIQDILFLHGNKSKINAIFYTHIHYEPQLSQNEQSFLELMRSENRAKWLAEPLNRLGISVRAHWKWFDVPGKNIAFLGAQKEDNENQAIYLKIYASNQDLVRNHEKMIFDAFGKNSSLVPHLLGEYSYYSLELLIFEGPPILETKFRERKKAGEEAILALWSLEPDSQLISQCCRTRPLLPHRLTEDKLSRLYICTISKQEEQMINELIASLSRIKEIILTLPLIIFNPGLKPGGLIMRKDGKAMVPSWSKWSLEPLGVGVDPNTKLSKLHKMLETASINRPDLKKISPALLLVTSYYSMLEVQINAQNFRKAISLVPDLLKLIQDDDQKYYKNKRKYHD